MQIPFSVSQVRTDLIFSDLKPNFTILSKCFSSIISPALTIIRLSLSFKSSHGVLPKTLSVKGEVIFPDSTISSTVTPLFVPQSTSLITASCATSTSRLVR